LKVNFQVFFTPLCSLIVIDLGLFVKALFHTPPCVKFILHVHDVVIATHLSQCLRVKQRLLQKQIILMHLLVVTNITSLILEDVVFQSSTNFLPSYTLMNTPSLFIHALQLF
jgi:hypothetical protein